LFPARSVFEPKRWVLVRLVLTHYLFGRPSRLLYTNPNARSHDFLVLRASLTQQLVSSGFPFLDVMVCHVDCPAARRRKGGRSPDGLLMVLVKIQHFQVYIVPWLLCRPSGLRSKFGAHNLRQSFAKFSSPMSLGTCSAGLATPWDVLAKSTATQPPLGI
jgi:hypothetical protein